MNDAWFALIAALIGGTGLKTIEYLLGRAKVREDQATSFRKELREDLTYTKTILSDAEEDLEQWKTKFYVLLDLFFDLNHSVREMGALLRENGVEYDMPVINMTEIRNMSRKDT